MLQQKNLKDVSTSCMPTLTHPNIKYAFLNSENSCRANLVKSVMR